MKAHDEVSSFNMTMNKVLLLGFAVLLCMAQAPTYTYDLGWTALGSRPSSVSTVGFAIRCRVAFGSVWVARTGSDSPTIKGADANILRFDQNTLSLQASISPGNWPSNTALDLAIDEANAKVWATDPVGNQVNRIDVATNKIDMTVTANMAGPRGIAVGGGNVLITQQSNHTAVVIDAVTGKHVGTASFTSGAAPYFPRFGASTFLVPLFGSKQLVKIDPSTAKIVATISVGLQPLMAITDGINNYVSNYGDNSVSVIDDATDTVSATWTGVSTGLSASLHDVVIARNELWVSDSVQGEVQVLDRLNGGARIQTLTAGTDSAGMCAGGYSIFVVNAGASTGPYTLQRWNVESWMPN